MAIMRYEIDVTSDARPIYLSILESDHLNDYDLIKATSGLSSKIKIMRH